MTKVYGEIEQPAVSDTLPLLGLVDLMTGKEYPYGPFTIEPYQILCLYRQD